MSSPESLHTRKDPSHRDRILVALRKGPVDQSMFDRPTCDGYGHIPQIARRIRDLRLSGCDIDTDTDGDGYATYRLLSEPSPVVVTKTAAEDDFVNADEEQASLFDLPSIPHYRQEAA